MRRTYLSAALLVCAALSASTSAQSLNATEAGQKRLRGLDPTFLDKSADPWTDFYQYACGKFSSLHPIPADRSEYGNFYLLIDDNERILHEILDRAAAGGADRTPNEQKIGDYYASCIRKPFDLIANRAKNEEWSALEDDFRTFLLTPAA